MLLAHRLNMRYAEYEGATHIGNLMALPARYVLNIVYANMLMWATKEDREDIEAWVTCTVAEAKAFAAEQAAEDAADRMRIARIAGEVM